MKRYVSIILLFAVVLTLCSCSIYGLDEQQESTTQAPQIVIIQDTTAPVTDAQQPDGNVQTQPQQPATTQSAQQTQPQQNNNAPAPVQEETTTAVKTYYTDDPNNNYIVTVANKYGVDKGCLVAFVRKNSKTPGATVLQFSGKRDSRGNLITTSDELLYVYDVQDNGTVTKTNRDGSDVEGMPGIAGKYTFELVEKYILPSIDKFKTENRLEG